MATTFLEIEGIVNLGRDPEMRYTPSGQPVCSFSAAANRSYNRSDGEKVEETTWVRITTWGKQAETCNQYLKKGSKIFFRGRLTPDGQGNPRIWNGNDGSPHASFEITASTVRFLSSNNEVTGEASSEESGGGEQTDEIPF